MTDADLLRRAATRLRDPYRCNTDPDVDHALAEVFDRAADAIRELQFLANTHRLTEPGLAHLADLLAVRPVARAILREPASGGVVEPSGPLTAEEATPFVSIRADPLLHGHSDGSGFDPNCADCRLKRAAEEATPDCAQPAKAHPFNENAAANVCSAFAAQNAALANQPPTLFGPAGPTREELMIRAGIYDRRFPPPYSAPELPGALIEEPDLCPKVHDAEDERRADDAHMAAGEAWMEHDAEGEDRG